MTLQKGGRSAADVAADADGLRADDSPVHGGRVLAYVYDSGVAGLDQAGRDALAAFGEVNALDPTVFPSVRRMENDLVGWGLDLLGGGPGSCGVVTSGGTESCIVAVLAAREAWRRRGGAGRASVIMPVTAHAAFVKAAHLLDMRVVTLPVDPETMRVRPQDVAAALEQEGDLAALVVASAPSYAHGVVDPVAEVATISAARGVPCHSDACIGGLVLPYLRRLGRDLPDYDLSVPGVRSLSVDLHKYGYAPKGASLLLFSDTDYRLGAYFAYSRWPGYPVVNTTLQSTKSAGPMAAAWTVSRILGDAGYEEAARRAIEATDRIVAAVEATPGLRVVGAPDSTLVAVGADGDEDAGGIDPFVLADRMKARDWLIQPQPACGDLPRTVHLTVQPSSLDTVEEFLVALAGAADECRRQPWAQADPGLLAAAAELEPTTLDEETVNALLAFAGLSGEGTGRLPDESAPVQALIEALSPELRDRLLSGFFSMLFTATREAVPDS
jgi:sphinganine-1-phosphate aldolase